MTFAGRFFAPSLYVGRLFARTILEIGLLAVLIEGIYLSERSISILRMIIDEPIGLSNFIPLLAWTAPEVHLALPIAVLIAVYRVILRSRERLEFIALASGGQSTLPLLRSATAVALVAFVLSQLISGVIYPYAKFAFRNDVDVIRYEALRAGSTPGRFLYFPNYTIYVFPTQATQDKRPIFVKQIVDSKSYRIVNADRTDLLDRPDTGGLTVRMLGVTVNDFPNVNEPWTPPKPEQEAAARDLFCDNCSGAIKSLRTVSVMRELDIKNLLKFEPRGVGLEEWTTPELLGLMSPPGGRAVKADAATEAVRRFVRSLLCFMAPFCAWLALTFTTRRSQAFALPLACAALMCADIGLSQFISAFVTMRAGILAVILALVVAALAVVLIRQIVVRQHLVIFPALARS